ncbi:MAG: hypothetical protein KH135_01710 [Firmicutes bacterium]|nr:hypothetical protein [Bacillota bacterium]
MKTNQMMRQYKELLLSLFCEAYPNVGYDYFSNIFDNIIFLMPYLKEEDMQFLYSSEFQNYNQLERVPKTIILNKVGAFLPLYYIDKGAIKMQRIVVCNMRAKDDLFNNQLLLHELKHALLYQTVGNCKRDDSIYISEKVGLGMCHISIDINKQRKSIVKNCYSETCEAFTDIDAKRMAQKLIDNQNEIFSGKEYPENLKNGKHGYYFQMFPMIEKIFSNYQCEIHEAEMENSSLFTLEHFPFTFIDNLEFCLDKYWDEDIQLKEQIGDRFYHTYEEYQKQKVKK